MKAVFIADAHLDGGDSDGCRYLKNLLNSIRGRVDELFILGDFFDFWFAGKNDVYPGYSDIVDLLLKIRKSGTGISFFEGNHDFFLGDYFEPHGIRVIPNEAVIDLDGKRVFMSHGDTIDTSKGGYLFLRRVLRSKMVYRIQEHLPSLILWYVSRAISRMSRSHEEPATEEINGKIAMFVAKKFEEGADAVVLGHYHSPRFEQYRGDEGMQTFVILGDWIRHYSYLVYEDGEFTMKQCTAAD